MATIRLVASSLTGHMSALSQSMPPDLEGDWFFVQRFEHISSNRSAASWLPECGVRFADGLQVQSRFRQPARKHTHHELLMSQPELFRPPLWNVQCKNHTDPNTGHSVLLIDLLLNLRTLKEYISQGTPVTGRRVFIESVRHMRTCASSYDGLDMCDNFIAWLLWPQTRGIDWMLYNSIQDVRALCYATRSTASEPLNLHGLHTAPYACQNYTISSLIALESGSKVYPKGKGVQRVSAGENAVMLCEHDRLRVHQEATHFVVRGGYLANNMGSGKSFCIIAACEQNIRRSCTLKKPRATLIVCPAQVVQHWCDQLAEHVTRPLTVLSLATRKDLNITYDHVLHADYVIVSFNLFCNPQFREFAESYSPGSPFNIRCETYTEELDTAGDSVRTRSHPFLLYFQWHRVVIDEFHELDQVVQGYVSQAVMSIRADIKWMVSGSPFMNAAAMVRNTRTFLIPDAWHDYSVMLQLARNHYIFDPNCCIRLPQLTESVVWLNLNSTERNVYEGLESQGRAQQLRACASIGITSIVQNSQQANVSTLEDMQMLVKQHMLQEQSLVEKRLSELHTILHEHGQLPVDNSRLGQYIRECQAEVTRLTKRQADVARSMHFLEEQAIPDLENSDCPICLGPVADPVAIIKTCGHTFCNECLKPALAQKGKCPVCRQTCAPRGHGVVVMDRVTRTEEEQLRGRYGTKLASLIQYIKQQDQKVIIFSQWDELLQDVGRVLKRVMPVLFCKGSVKQKQCSIDRFRTSDQHNVIMLSTLNSGSGCDLSVAHKVLMLDIVDGPKSFVMDVERQAISRCYRVGQRSDVQIVRFLARNTLEEAVYNGVYKDIDYKSFYASAS